MVSALKGTGVGLGLGSKDQRWTQKLDYCLALQQSVKSGSFGGFKCQPSAFPAGGTAASFHSRDEEKQECTAKFKTKKTHFFQSLGEVGANGSRRKAQTDVHVWCEV